MIMHLIKYNVKVFSKNMELIFWMFFFPIFMMTIFGNTLGNVKLNLDLKEETVYVYVDNTVEDKSAEEKPEKFKKAQDNTSRNDNQTSTKEENIISQKASAYNDKIYDTYVRVLGNIFDVKEIPYSKPEDLNEALQELEQGKALAIVKIVLEPSPKLSMKVVSSETSEQVLKSVLDELNHKSFFAKTVVEKKLESFYNLLEAQIQQEKDRGTPLSDAQVEARIYEEIGKIFEDDDFTNVISGENALPEPEILNIAGKTRKPFTNIIYSLLGYSIFTSIFMGFYISQTNRADKTSIGHRIGASPVLNSQVITSNIIVSMLISVIINCLVPIYGNFYFDFFNLQYAPHYGLLLVVAVFTSVCIGMIFNFVLRFNENVSNGIMTFILLFFGFTSGMMAPNMKSTMDRIPLLNKINPVALIGDSIYAIFEYEDAQRFYNNILILALMGVIAFALLIIFNRRKHYDSL